MRAVAEAAAEASRRDRTVAGLQVRRRIAKGGNVFAEAAAFVVGKRRVESGNKRFITSPAAALAS